MPSPRLSACVLLACAATACGSRTELVPARAGSNGEGGSGGEGASSGARSSAAAGTPGSPAAGGGCLPDGEACASSAACCTGTCAGGVCGEPACRPGEGPVVLAEGLPWPFGLVVDSEHVFFTSYDEKGGLYRVPKRGGEVVALLAPLDYPEHVAGDAEHLFVTVTGDHVVLRLAKDGSGMTTFATGQNGPTFIALDEMRAFWTSHLGGTIQSAPKAGGAVETIVAGELGPYRLALGPEHVYWSGLGSGLRAAPKTGETTTTLATGDPRTIAVSDGIVYWTDPSDDTLKRLGPNGAIEVLASFGAGFPDGLAIDGTHVYVALAEGSILRVPKDGGEPVPIATGQSLPALVAVDRHCVYWTNTSISPAGDGAVMRAPKDVGDDP